MTRVPEIDVTRVAHHRNGVDGAPFYVVLFDALDETVPGDKPLKRGYVATVFDRPGQVAVLQLLKLQNAIIDFGQNSWRGDYYEPALRRAIAQYERDRTEIRQTPGGDQ